MSPTDLRGSQRGVHPKKCPFPGSSLLPGRVLNSWRPHRRGAPWASAFPLSEPSEFLGGHQNRPRSGSAGQEALLVLPEGPSALYADFAGGLRNWEEACRRCRLALREAATGDIHHHAPVRHLQRVSCRDRAPAGGAPRGPAVMALSQLLPASGSARETRGAYRPTIGTCSSPTTSPSSSRSCARWRHGQLQLGDCRSATTRFRWPGSSWSTERS